MSDVSQPIRILSVDDRDLVREGIAAILSVAEGIEFLAEASTSAATGLFRQHRPDITLVDIRLPDRTGIETVIELREFPNAKFIALTSYDGDQTSIALLKPVSAATS